MIAKTLRLFADILVPFHEDDEATIDMICIEFDDGSSVDVGRVTTFWIDHYGSDHKSLDTTIRAYRIDDDEIHVFSEQFGEDFRGRRSSNGQWTFAQASGLKQPAGSASAELVLPGDDLGAHRSLPRSTAFDSVKKALSICDRGRTHRTLTATLAELIPDGETEAAIAMTAILNEGHALFILPREGGWDPQELAARTPYSVWLLPVGDATKKPARHERVTDPSLLQTLERARIRRLLRGSAGAYHTESID